MFVTTVAARFVLAIMPNRSVMELAVAGTRVLLLVLLAVRVIYPVEDNLHATLSDPANSAASELVGQFRQMTQISASVLPSAGLVPFLSADILVLVGIRQSRRMVVASSAVTQARQHTSRRSVPAASNP